MLRRTTLGTEGTANREQRIWPGVSERRLGAGEGFRSFTTRRGLLIEMDCGSLAESEIQPFGEAI